LKYLNYLEEIGKLFGEVHVSIFFVQFEKFTYTAGEDYASRPAQLALFVQGNQCLQNIFAHLDQKLAFLFRANDLEQESEKGLLPAYYW